MAEGVSRTGISSLIIMTPSPRETHSPGGTRTECDDVRMANPTRRALLAQLAFLGCASRPGGPGPPGTEVPEWRFAIGLNGFGSSETHHGVRYVYEEILEFARDEGFQGIELWRGWRDGYPDPADDGAIRAIRQQIESYGLRVFSLQGGVRGVNPISDDAQERDEYASQLKLQVEMAERFGCDAMGLWAAGRPPDGAGEDEIIERLAGTIRPVCRHAVERGIILAIEGEPPLIVNSAERYRKLFASVGMDEFKVIFDPSHFDMLGGANGRPQDLLRELGVDRVGYVQFSDGNSTLRPLPGGRASTSRHLACGEGIYDIPLLCTLLVEGGFNGWMQMDSWGTVDAYHTSKSCKDAILAHLQTLQT